MTTERGPNDVIDRASGKVRVLSTRCDTCIFWPEDRMRLGRKRTDQVISENVARDALLTCHSTLPYGENPNFGPAVCAGFWARYRGTVLAGRLAQLLGIVKVEPVTSGVESSCR